VVCSSRSQPVATNLKKASDYTLFHARNLSSNVHMSALFECLVEEEHEVLQEAELSGR
jgi:hypothetical protein